RVVAQVDELQPDLLREGGDQVLLPDEPHVDEHPAKAPIGAVALAERFVQFLAGDQPLVQENLAELLRLLHRDPSSRSNRSPENSRASATTSTSPVAVFGAAESSARPSASDARSSDPSEAIATGVASLATTSGAASVAASA